MRAGTPLCWRSVVLLVALASSAFAWAQPHGYAINSKGYDLDDSRVAALWRIDLSTGSEEYIGWTGRGEYIDIEGIAFGEEGRLYGADDATHTLVLIGTETGNAIPVGGSRSNMGLRVGPSMDFGLTFTCEGELLMSSAGTESLYRVDPGGGAVELVGDLGVPIVDLAVVGQTVYGLGLGTDEAGREAVPNLYRIDSSTAAAELIGPLGTQASRYIQAGLAADEEGWLWAITDRNSVPPSTDRLPSEILRIDPSSGEAVRVAETLVGIESLAISGPGSCDRGEPLPGQYSVDIPAMSPAGLVLLCLVLLALALGRLRGRTAS